MLPYMQLFPMGNSPGQSNDGGLAFNAFDFNSPQDASSNIYTVRMDVNITRNGHHSAYVRGTLADVNDDISAAQFPGQPVSSVLLNNSKGIAPGYTAQLSPNLVNNLRYSFTRLGEQETGSTNTDFDIRFFASNIAFNRGFGRRVPAHEIKDDVSGAAASTRFNSAAEQTSSAIFERMMVSRSRNSRQILEIVTIAEACKLHWRAWGFRTPRVPTPSTRPI